MCILRYNKEMLVGYFNVYNDWKWWDGLIIYFECCLASYFGNS